MNALQTIRRNAGLQLLRKAAPTVSGHIRVGGRGNIPNLGDWVNSSNPVGRIGKGSSTVWIPGTHINWDNITGEVLSCPAAQACLNWKARNRPQAPVIVEQFDKATMDWSPIPHNLTRRLRRPNPVYSGDTLLNMSSFSLDVNGNAYWVIERSAAGDVMEFWWWPHNDVKIPPEYSRSDFIESYLIRNREGRWLEVPATNIVHLKWGLDPEDWRFGMSPIASTKRGIYSLQQSANYRANILKNFGTVGVILSSKTQDMVFDPDQMKQAWNDRTTGDNVGSVFAVETPIDAHFPGVTPQTMTIETMDDRPEADECAVFGLSRRLVGLHSGRHESTYNNVKEMREAGWEECIIPENLIFGSQLSHRLLAEPTFSGANSVAAVEVYLDTYRVGFDYSPVRALQPDLDALHKRARENWKANLITLGEWCQEVGRPKPEAALADMRFGEFTVKPAEEEVDGEDEKPEPDAGKGYDLRELLEMDAIAALEKIHAGSAFAGNGVH